MNFDAIYPSIDLHGEDRVSATLRVKEFIEDSVFLKRKKIKSSRLSTINNITKSTKVFSILYHISIEGD